MRAVGLRLRMRRALRPRRVAIEHLLLRARRALVIAEALARILAHL